MDSTAFGGKNNSNLEKQRQARMCGRLCGFSFTVFQNVRLVSQNWAIKVKNGGNANKNGPKTLILGPEIGCGDRI